MIEANNPEINVNELMHKIREEVAKRHIRYQSAYRKTNATNIKISGIKSNISYIEALIKNAESRTDIRTKWPDKLNKFPFNFSSKLPKLLLKIINFLFKDQREVNLNLINCLKEYVVVNQQLIEEIITLRTQMDERLIETFNQEQLQILAKEEQHLLDAFYVAFEEQFRGTREEIGNRLKVYLPLIAETKIGTTESPILDIGCGRGEWLDILRESGYMAIGLDINRLMLEECKYRGLKVIEADIITYLRTLPDSSLGAVTGFHLIEHLPFAALMKLLQEVARVLQPGGLTIFETPNPKNLVVGACNFYADPTHYNLIFPETIQFCLQYQGFYNVKLLYLNPVDNSPFDHTDPRTQVLHNWFFGHRDYAVIGYKK